MIATNYDYFKVTVYTQIKSYGLFNLVIDLGSSLGLWLGISALGMNAFLNNNQVDLV